MEKKSTNSDTKCFSKFILSYHVIKDLLDHFEDKLDETRRANDIKMVFLGFGSFVLTIIFCLCIVIPIWKNLLRIVQRHRQGSNGYVIVEHDN